MPSTSASVGGRPPTHSFNIRPNVRYRCGRPPVAALGSSLNDSGPGRLAPGTRRRFFTGPLISIVGIYSSAELGSRVRSGLAGPMLGSPAAPRPRHRNLQGCQSERGRRIRPCESSRDFTAGGNRIRTIGPASGKVVDAEFQRSDPGRSNTDFGRRC
jgi:hypothetical protein